LSLFDQIIDRRSSDSVKWAKYAGRDILPLWVADMDFAAPPPVLEALHRRLDHGVLGYPQPWPSLAESVVEHLAREYGWAIEADWIVWLPGLVTGLNVACRAVEGGVFTATPVYPPFLSAPRFSGRELITAHLSQAAGGAWQWDLEAVAAALKPDTGLFLLCHPHNPVGRRWREDELLAVADLCERNDLVVCSDEIHCGLLLDRDQRHRPFASLSPEMARRTITLMAPSKTFNIPGLGCAFAVIGDPGLRCRFRAAMDGIVPHVNVLGLHACEAAFRHGGPWHAELLDYLAANRDRVEATVARLPGLAMAHVEATYLAWIDAQGLGLPDPAGHFESHGLGLSGGTDFGPGKDFSGWVRLNFGCPRATLDAALARLETACTKG